MHSQQPPRRRGGPNYQPAPGPYGQPPGPHGPYGQQPPDDPYGQPGSWQQPPPWQPPGGPYQQQPGGPYQQPGDPYQRPPGGPHQQPPRRKRHLGLKITLGVVGGIIVLIIVAAALGGSKANTPGASTPAAAASTAAASPAASTPGIGDKVRDGKFQFVITKITHAKSVGDTSLGLGDTAQGEYTILHITVTNIGSEPQTLDDSSQYVYDSQGRQFDASTSADLDINGAGNGGVFLNDINPGNTVHGKIAFDLPQGDKAVRAELHDSMFSGGVTVSLR
jgi:hypothetical protein